MKANGFGLVIRIGNSSYSTYYLNSGIFVSSNFESSIAIRREVKITMVKPYSNCEIDTDSPKFMRDMDLYNLIGQSDYEYTQQLCFAQCLQKRTIAKLAWFVCLSSLFGPLLVWCLKMTRQYSLVAVKTRL